MQLPRAVRSNAGLLREYWERDLAHMASLARQQMPGLERTQDGGFSLSASDALLSFHLDTCTPSSIPAPRGLATCKDLQDFAASLRAGEPPAIYAQG